MNYALNALAARALSMSELRQRLARRAENDSDVDHVIAKLKEVGYLNDRRLAESFAAARIENQSFGRMRVLRDLKARRVAPAVAEKAVHQAFQEVNEVELIERYLERKFRGRNLGEMLQDDRRLASVFRKLRGAGFSVGNSIQVLKRFAARAELLEDEAEGES
jgi:regulatory protein